MKREILIVSIAFLPNIGGVETHLNDLVNELLRDGWAVRVLTYQPLQTPVQGKWVEIDGDLTIVRLPIAKGWFYKLVDKPLLEFLFLAPLQFFAVPLYLIIKPDISVINAQGLVAGFAVAFWSKFFSKRYVIALQNIYHFPEKSLYFRFAKWIIDQADAILSQSAKSSDEITSLGISRDKIVEFTHWEDVEKFRPINKIRAKKELGLKGGFVVSFFGRLVEVKGVKELLDSIKIINPKAQVLIYGEGPLRSLVEESMKRFSNLQYMGIVSPDELPLHYSAADIVIMPSTHEEGFGRVAVESLLCGTPVIAANRGALPEIVNERVGGLIEVTPENIARAINYFYTNPGEVKKRTNKSRSYAVKNFSEKNSKVIIDTFNP